MILAAANLQPQKHYFILIIQVAFIFHFRSTYALCIWLGCF